MQGTTEGPGEPVPSHLSAQVGALGALVLDSSPHGEPGH